MHPVSPNTLVAWNKTEAVTAVLQWYEKQTHFRSLGMLEIPYCKGTGTETFAYRNVKVRAILEEAGNIVNLGWFINQAIAAAVGYQHTPVFARVAKVSEWTKVLALDTKTCRIATNPAPESGDDSVFQST